MTPSCHSMLMNIWYSAITSGGVRPAALIPLRFDRITTSGYLPGLPGTRLYPNSGGRYWASAAKPRHDVCTFAVAGSNGTTLLNEKEGQWSLDRPKSVQGLMETVAIDWLGPNVILTGNRLGEVRLWDTRAQAESSQPRVQHPIAINYLRRISENLIVLAGLQNTVSRATFIQPGAGLIFQLCTYDLRYANRANPDCATQCYDWFSTYHNNLLTHQSNGLDVHGNLVAAATDDRRVQIFDVKQGVELNTRIRDVFAKFSCVRFVDEQMSGEGLKLMVAAGSRIDWWTFEGPREKSVHLNRYRSN